MVPIYAREYFSNDLFYGFEWKVFDLVSALIIAVKILTEIFALFTNFSGYSDGYIRGFAWADLLSKNCRLSWEIPACTSSSPDGSPYEINGLAISAVYDNF